MMSTTVPVGIHLRDWRQHRRMSQLDLALQADVSARHISFLETGRAQPSRAMLLRLAERLDIPLRERNSLLLAAGFAPVYSESALDAPSMRSAKQAIDLVLAGHEPYPALAIDRHWNMIAANRSVAPLLDGVSPELLEPPINVLRLSMHPAGLISRVVNAGEWREHVLARIERQIDATADVTLVALRAEISALTVDSAAPLLQDAGSRDLEIVVPLRLRFGEQLLSFLTTTTVFGTPMDVTLAELAIEAFYPADTVTADVLRSLVESTR